MATSIRLSRGGSKKRPYYKIVVTDSRAPRDGKFIERIGSYNPLLAKGDENRVVINVERAKHWLGVGAQPTDRVARFLDAAGLKERAARNNPNKAVPGKKATERAEDKAAKLAEAEEARKAAEEAAKAPAPAAEEAPAAEASEEQAEAKIDQDRPVTLATIIGAHGVAGELRLKLFGEGPESLKLYKTLNAAGRVLTLKSIPSQPDGAVARFAEVTDRNAAEALRGVELTVPRSALPPLEEGEYYHCDLIGLSCVSDAGEGIGSVVAVENFGAGDILEIQKPDGKRFMVPIHAAQIEAERAVIDAAFVDQDGVMSAEAISKSRGIAAR